MMAAMRPPWQRSYCAATANAAERRLHDINHAHAHKFTMSLALSQLPSRLLHRRSHSTLSLAMLYSCRECFIAGIFILCPHTHTHARRHSDSAHSLRAKADGPSRAREKEQLFLCQTYAGVVVGGQERKKGKQLNWAVARVWARQPTSLRPFCVLENAAKCRQQFKILPKLKQILCSSPLDRFQHWPNEKPVRGARTPNWFRAHTRAHTNLWLHVAFSFRNWANCFVYGRLLFRSTCEIYGLLSFHSAHFWVPPRRFECVYVRVPLSLSHTLILRKWIG